MNKNLEKALYESIMKSVAKTVKKALNENTNIPPEESAINILNGIYTGKQFKYFNYFGNCINTVDVDKMWDATQMLYWLSTEVKIVNTSSIIDKLRDGDRKIPKTLIKIIDRLCKDGNIDNFDYIVSGIDDYQKIMVIYCSDTDIHYFFDCI